MAYLRFASLTILLAAAVPAQAGTQPDQGAFLPRGMAADAPAGFTEMCARYQALCLLGASRDSLGGSDGALGATGAALMSLQQPAQPPMDLRRLVKTVNQHVNRHVIQKTDMAAMGIGEYWRRLPTDNPVGDCEDIAIEKRIRLMEAGFPAERLFYSVAFVRNIGLHTVLIARMDDGDVVLDSLTPRIERWQDTHYVWLRRQVAGSPLNWERIDSGFAGPIRVAADDVKEPPVS